ncbi:MAG: carboxypeptidase regulatory-like domain-containing protein [Planctomycetota bacterium]
MARGVLVVLALAALGFGVWIAMGELGGGPSHDALDEGGGGSALVEEVSTGPKLVAHGRALTAEPQLTGHAWAVQVQVVDPKGRPAADVNVTLRFIQPRYDPRGGDPAARRAYAAWSATRLRRTFERRGLEADGEELRAEGRTDKEGRVSLASQGPGQFRLEAHPDLPLASDRGYVDVAVDKTPEDVTLRLFDVVEFEGRVVDTKGHGVVAQVMPQSRAETVGWWRGTRVSTDGDGRFTAHAPPGDLTLSVTLGKQLIVVSRGHSLPSTSPIEVVVPVLDAALDVTVVDPTGAAVPGAVVQVTTRDAWQANLMDETGPDGVVHFLAPSAEVASIGVEAAPWLAYEGRAPLAEWAPLVLAAGKPGSVRIELMAGGVVTGVVRAGEGGPGLADVTVRALLGQGSQGAYGWNQPEATSDASGRYRIEGVPLGRHILYATHTEWFHPDVDLAVRGSAPPVDATVVMLEGGTEVERDIVMQQGVVVSGIVVDTNARPIAGARLMPGPDRNNALQTIWQWGVNAGYLYSAELGTAGADGRFRLGRPPGSKLVLAAVTDEGASPYTDDIEIKEGSSVPELRLVVEPGATVRGRVVRGEDREGVVGASVSSWSTDRKRYPSVQRQAKSDAEGRFELVGLPPVGLQLNASTTGGNNRVQKQIPAPDAGSIMEDVELVMGEGHTLTLILLDEEDAKPIADQMFTLQGHQGGWGNGTTDAEGRAAVENLSAGRYSISLQGSDGSLENGGSPITVPAPEPVTIRMRRRKQNVVEGRVLMPDGAPVPSAACRSRRRATAAGTRCFPWAGVAVEARRPSAARSACSSPSIRPTRSTSTGPAMPTAAPRPARTRAQRLGRGGRRGSHRDSPGGERASPGAHPGRGGQGAEERLGRSGAWWQHDAGARGRPRTPHRAARGRDGEDLHQRAGLPQPERRLGGPHWRHGDGPPLGTGGTIEGRVDWGDDSPQPVTISSNWRVDGKSGWAYTQVEDDGSFVLGGLPDGASITLQLGIMRTSEAGQARMGVSVADVRVGTRELVIRASGGLALRGRVVDGAGRGVSGAQVQVTDSAKQNAQLVTAGDGSFEVQGLAPGEADVRAWRGDQHNLAVREKVQAGSRGVEIRLLDARYLQGTVIGDADARKNLAVRALSKSSPKEAVRQGPVQADGSFSIPVPDDGTRYDLWAIGMGATHYGHVSGVDGVSAVRIRLVPGGSIDGRVDGIDEADVKSVWILARNEIGLSTYARLKEDRTWTLSGLPDGPWTLTLGGRGGYTTQTMEGVANGTSGYVVQASK